MSKNEKITCRVAIQVCIGHFSDGRERHRTFSMKGIDPDAAPEAIAAVVRALAPVLAYPITKVRKIVKRVIVIFEKGVMPAALESPVSQNSQNVGGVAHGVPFGRNTFARDTQRTGEARRARTFSRPCRSSAVPKSRQATLMSFAASGEGMGRFMQGRRHAACAFLKFCA